LKLFYVFAALLVSLTLSAQQVKLSDKELYNAIWAMGQMYPDGFTLDLNTMRQPEKGIMVSYIATQNSFDKKSIPAVVKHAREHDGLVGGWYNPENGKYYFEDVGLRNIIAESDLHDGDIEKILENVVYQQLVRMGYEVKIGQLQAGEVDFVCTKYGQKIYVQVTYLMASDETKERELSALKRISDSYPKYIISMSPMITRTNTEGIIHIGLRDFLINGF